MRECKNKREVILWVLYNLGYRYISGDDMGFLTIHKDEPDFRSHAYYSNVQEDFDWGKEYFEAVKYCGLLDIEEELEIVNWEDVKSDTPVLVRENKADKWKRRHFHTYAKGSRKPFICYSKGTTSFTCKDVEPKTSAWAFCKLYDGKKG